MVEGTGLENQQALARLVGSNPTLTANTERSRWGPFAIGAGGSVNGPKFGFGAQRRRTSAARTIPPSPP